MVFPAMTEHAEIMQKVIAKQIDSNEPLEAKDLAKRFGMDSMGSCTFGFEINTLTGENQEFQEIAKRMMKITWKKVAENVVNRDILKIFRMRTSDPEIEDYVRKLVSNTLEYREKNNVQRNDIFQYIQQITEQDCSGEELIINKKLSREQMVLQLYTFFTGGFETSSTLTSFTLLELSQNQDIQDRLRQNIRDKLTIHKSLTYEALMDMEYLDWVTQGKFLLLDGKII